MNPVITILLTAVLASFSGCGANDKYEVIERTQRDNVPDVQGTGTHTEVDYVLLHDGHKIYAVCDAAEISDQIATCGFRPLRTYVCKAPPDNIEKATYPFSDLKCKDGAGHNVYLYVSKKE
jgi:hypothetical protein